MLFVSEVQKWKSVTNAEQLGYPQAKWMKVWYILKGCS
jgi:hypothetical protein